MEWQASKPGTYSSPCGVDVESFKRKIELPNALKSIRIKRGERRPSRRAFVGRLAREPDERTCHGFAARLTI